MHRNRIANRVAGGFFLPQPPPHPSCLASSSPLLNPISPNHSKYSVFNDTKEQ